MARRQGIHRQRDDYRLRILASGRRAGRKLMSQCLLQQAAPAKETLEIEYFLRCAGNTWEYY